jgi:hypothetical protein
MRRRGQARRCGVSRPGPQHQPTRRPPRRRACSGWKCTFSFRRSDSGSSTPGSGLTTQQGCSPTGIRRSAAPRRSGRELYVGRSRSTKTVGNELRRQRIPLSALPPTRPALSHRLDNHRPACRPRPSAHAPLVPHTPPERVTKLSGRARPARLKPWRKAGSSVDRRRSSQLPARPVTPEVAGSSPVAPAL